MGWRRNTFLTAMGGAQGKVVGHRVEFRFGVQKTRLFLCDGFYFLSEAAGKVMC